MRRVILITVLLFALGSVILAQCPSYIFLCYDCGLPNCWFCGYNQIPLPPANSIVGYCGWIGSTYLYCYPDPYYLCRLTRVTIVYSCDSGPEDIASGYLYCDWGY